MEGPHDRSASQAAGCHLLLAAKTAMMGGRGVERRLVGDGLKKASFATEDFAEGERKR